MAKNDEKTVSRKQSLHEEWVSKGSPKMGKSDSKAFVAAFKKAAAAKAAAEATLEQAQADVSELVANLIRSRGKGRLNIDGDVYVPMSRGETCYLRTEGGGDVEQF